MKAQLARGLPIYDPQPLIQYGALPYRFTPDRALRVLLVTSRRSGRWIIPKGWPIKGLKPAKSAAREAFEEAGVLGRVARDAIGAFAYEKLIEREGRYATCEVQVFPLCVEQELTVWPEAGERRLLWVSSLDAMALVSDGGLRDLISGLGLHLTDR